MVAPPQLVVWAVLGVAAFGLYTSVEDMPASIATDVGRTDEDACAALRANADWAVARLEASGFPHATGQNVETYRLVRTDTNTVEAAITIHWIDRAAYCAPFDTNSPYTVSFDMNAKAYNALVHELTSVLTTGEMSSDKVTSGGYIVWGTSITNAEGSPNNAYRVELAKWAAGMLVRGAA